MTRIKICGVTTVADARLCAAASVDAIGVNLWPGTARCVDEATAAAVHRAVGESVDVVAVVVDAGVDDVRGIRARTGIQWVQLHGGQSPDVVGALLPHAYKALRISGEETLREAADYPGEPLLLDAAVAGMRGGTGRTFDWGLASELARRRKVMLAGGLTPDNVAGAIARVRPHGVDVASGVESERGVKDPDRVRAFVEAVRVGR